MFAIVLFWGWVVIEVIAVVTLVVSNDYSERKAMMGSAIVGTGVLYAMGMLAYNTPITWVSVLAMIWLGLCVLGGFVKVYADDDLNRRLGMMIGVAWGIMSIYALGHNLIT